MIEIVAACSMLIRDILNSADVPGWPVGEMAAQQPGTRSFREARVSVPGPQVEGGAAPRPFSGGFRASEIRRC